MEEGHALEAARQWHGAADAYHEAVKVGPSDLRGVGFLTTFLSACPLGAAFARAGRTKEAEAAYRESLAAFESLPTEIRDRPWTQIDLAWLLATCPIPQLRDPVRAVELSRRAVEKVPGQRVFHPSLGVALYRAGDWRASVAELRRSMDLDKGDDCFAWYFLAMAYWQLGQKDEARACYDKAVAWKERNLPWPLNEDLLRLRAEAEALMGLAELPADVFARP
jgi:tetratricopeptide (TPR) repeat protein